MTCAHELGHFALGHESTSDTTVDLGQEAELVEQTANQFAYALLAPAWLVAATMRQKRWGRNNLRNPAIVYQLSLRLGMSYKRAWLLVETMNACFKSPLVAASRGGRARGGATLTTHGERVLDCYRRMEALTGEAIAEEMAKLRSLLRDKAPTESG